VLERRRCFRCTAAVVALLGTATGEDIQWCAPFEGPSELILNHESVAALRTGGLLSERYFLASSNPWRLLGDRRLSLPKKAEGVPSRT